MDARSEVLPVESSRETRWKRSGRWKATSKLLLNDSIIRHLLEMRSATRQVSV